MSIRHAAAALLGLILLPAQAAAAGKSADAMNATPAAIAMPEASAARPLNDTATARAFDALLSLPEARPAYGSRDVARPVGFDDASETGLIRWLDRQQQAGADLNATRHKGSLLQHAIRAGLEDTALWLLQHGADPLRPVEDSTTAQDTLGLALKYRRWKVLDVLLRRADVVAPSRDEHVAGAWQEAIEHSGNGDLERLLALGLRWPGGRSRGWVISTALRKNCYGVLQRLIPELAASAASGTTAMPLCGSTPSPGQVLTLDANLPEPLLLQLTGHIGSAEELDALAALPLRRPYHDLTFMRSLLFNILYKWTNTELQVRALKQIPLPALKTALADDYVFRDWLRWAALQPAATGDWALDLLGDSLPQRAALALRFMNEGLTGTDILHFDPQARSPQLSAGWGRLLQRLPTPLPAVDGVDLWQLVPAEQRPLLLRRGYRPDDGPLPHWLYGAGTEEIGTLWPLLAQARPELRDTILELLLKGYGFVRDQGCKRAWPGPELLEKAKRLHAAGARPPPPLPLPQQCADRAGSLYAEELLALQAAGLVRLEAPVARFAQVADECRFAPDAVWRHALMHRPEQITLPLRAARLVPVPGQADCAVLVTAGRGGGRETVVEETLEGSESYLGECAQEETEAALLRRSGDGLSLLRLDDFPLLRNLCTIKDLQDGSALLLSGARDDRSCGIMPPTLLRWTDPAVPPQALDENSEPAQALEKLCRQNSTDPLCYACGHDGQLSDFIDQHWGTDKAAFLAAVTALDQAELARQRDAGLPAHWIAQALDALSAESALTLAEKRRRIAWLFRQPALEQSILWDFSRIEQLTQWLPSEDWRPLISAAGGDDYLTRRGAEIARQYGRQDLACRWQQASGAACTAPSR